MAWHWAPEQVKFVPDGLININEGLIGNNKSALIQLTASCPTGAPFTNMVKL